MVHISSPFNRISQHRTHSAVHSSSPRRSLSVSFSSCTIYQTYHNRHHGHILDFLPCRPIDRPRADSSQPRRQIPSKTEVSRFLGFQHQYQSNSIPISSVSYSMQLSRAARIILVGAPGMSQIHRLSMQEINMGLMTN